MQLKWFQQKGNNQKQKLYLLARKVTTLQEKEKSGINSGALAEKKKQNQKKRNIKHEKISGPNSCGILKIASHQNVQGSYAKLERKKTNMIMIKGDV